ncbi:MAG: sel1 repeat family protein [Chitinophagaceae bacterium]|jgi:TPR repeat protein|nr:sel1 repeat family protein [Chitinophagaceae bacterium]
MKQIVVLLLCTFLVTIPAVHAQKRDAKTELQEAERLYNKKDYYSASYIYKAFANVLNPEQRFLYAFCLVNSNPIKENVDEAIRQLKTASTGGNSKAMVALYYIYMQNQLVPQDRSEAVIYITKSAEYENPEGMYIYGTLLSDGNFISRDTIKAYKYFEKAAAKNNYDAQNALGYMHFTGTRAKKDLVKAAYYWKLAAESGTNEAVYNYAYLLLETNGNKTMAIANLQSLAQKGYTLASYLLGSVYYEGKYAVPQDIEKSLLYFRTVMGDDAFKKNNKEQYNYARELVAYYAAIEPSSDVKLLRKAFDELIQKITSNPAVPETESNKRVFILNKLKAAYASLQPLGFREGRIYFGSDSSPLEPVLLTKPYHQYETTIAEIANKDSAQKVYQKWIRVLKQLYPEHTVKETATTSGIHYQLSPEKGYLGIYISLFDYTGNPNSPLIKMTIIYTVRSK